MPNLKLPRNLLALITALLFLLALVLLLLISDIGFRVWDHLQQAPEWFSLLYLGGVLLLGLPFGYWIWRLLSPTKRPRQPSAPAAPPSEAALEQRLAEAKQEGVSTTEAERTRRTLELDRAAGEIRVALFGEISSGKSALAGALIPDAQVVSDVVGGTTRRLDELRWTSPAGDSLILVDMPGLNETDRDLDEMARAEALRAHAVIYLCEGDLTRDQQRELETLLQLGKPTILALNKSDRLQPDELAQVSQRLRERAAAADAVVAVQSGGRERLVKVLPDGREVEEERPVTPRLEELRQALQNIIDRDSALLDSLRDSSLFVLISHQLDRAEADYRKGQAKRLISAYAKKAVMGALAAVTPGTDLIIQGYLGRELIRELTELYRVPIRQIESDKLMELAQKHLGKKHTILLALAGNALKAFPGLGTLGGGLLHAVAYGIIFDSLGRAVAESLASRGELPPQQAATLFEEYLGEDMESAAQRFARLVAAERPERNENAD